MTGVEGTVRGALAALLFLIVPAVLAQNAPPQTLDEALHQMFEEAGVIFAGQVIAIHQQPGGEGASGAVEVEFRVDQAVRGCTAGTPYALREWSGLWTGGVRRYRVGERLLMFLHTPSASGLSSPVNGMDGAVPVHGSPIVVATGYSAQYSVADLRWVATQVLHPVSYRKETAHFDHRAGPKIGMRTGSTGTESVDITVSPDMSSENKGAASIPAQQASVETVIGMLKSWQEAKNAAR